MRCAGSVFQAVDAHGVVAVVTSKVIVAFTRMAAYAAMVLIIN